MSNDIPPNLTAKLSAPPKKSIFERAKAEAEAKKAREKAENAAALEDFVKSFDDDDDGPQQGPGFSGRRGGVGGDGARGGTFGGGAGPGKRHFTNTNLKSGPGSLGPAPSVARSGPGSLGAAGSGSGLGKKRHFDEFTGRRERDERMFAYGEGESKRGVREDRSEEEMKAAAKPTLHLSSLPPGTSPAVIKGLFAPSPLNVEGVRVLGRMVGEVSERHSMSAIVTLAAETPSSDIETMVSHLQNKYLGFGFNLSISRYLSSAALTGTTALGSNAPMSNMQNLPFGAKVVQQHTSLSRAPPPGQGPGRFAPPASYTSSTPYGPRATAPPTQVNVQVPNDLKQLRLIHKTIEALLTYGPEFEALLMSRPHIQRDERWSWLWSSKSTGGVYYRWRLWDILTNAQARRRQQAGYSAYNGARQQKGEILFEGQSTWLPPENNLKFEHTTQIEQFISDDDYNSSDEEDFDEESRGGGLAGRYRDHQRVATADVLAENDGQGYLNPLAKTKLIHLLSRLPETNARLRKGDVARVTGFAIEHSGAGADEVAELITSNVVNPFRYSVKQPKDLDQDGDQSEPENNTPKPALGGPETEEPSGEKKDTTPSSLVALYLISDILSASSTSGVRHAWRYRSLFQQHLLQQKSFETLGRLPRRYAWGKLRAEKWRRQVQIILGLWEGWCVFEEPIMKGFQEGFHEPPLTKEEQEREEEKSKAAAEREKEQKLQSSSKWRSVHDARPESDAGIDRKPVEDSDVDINMDGAPMADDDDDDAVLTDENLDGVLMVDSSDEEMEDAASTTMKDVPPAAVSEAPAANPKDSEVVANDNMKPVQQTTQVTQGRRARPRAADFDDMFE